ncbi:hypothetical protein PCA31118_00697 [Pandoraea captiosa]|uniref:DUF2252 domain-containing protein n=1 Tax=Pandoraea captiosa TaxID=2508302 RepID=A0A5E4ZMT0_9BURK|nr:DUF2252 family protein [Pandoraea captiosa]VVE61722.1 hypothetical protein PCA31118_00697 [Pandoraea captiosa]
MPNGKHVRSGSKPRKKVRWATPEARLERLTRERERKMARSPHAYVRGSTARFYEWLAEADVNLPQGPAIWICGDCHTGNLGPLADARGHVDVLIRDLDQTVVGNPVHDLIRLALSLASAARGSALSGLTIIHMLESLTRGYLSAFARDGDGDEPEKDKANGGKGNGKTKRAKTDDTRPEIVDLIMREAVKRSWKHLALERIEDIRPRIPLGRRFWPLSKTEQKQIGALFKIDDIAGLATSLRGRPNHGTVEVLDAAYWVKGCSSLGRLRYAVLLDVDGDVVQGDDLCLMDLKEGVSAAAPRYAGARMPRDNAQRVVMGARHLSPSLGERMRAVRLMDRAVVIRELLPQDLKLDIETLARDDAAEVAHYLARVVGKAHARQMDDATCRAWLTELQRNRSKTIDTPVWLWNSVVQLTSEHEAAYLEHCKRMVSGESAG